MSNWIDLSVGEAHIIREKFIRVFDFDSTYFPFIITKETCEYPPPNGLSVLVDYLEEKHQAPVIITNGAKQALGASFYTMNKIGKCKIGMRSPYWGLIPPLAKMHGLQCSINENYNSYLAVLPNNPDGFMHEYNHIKYLADYHKDIGIPFIHDAAYYTHVYLPDSYNLDPLGDIQIFSISKMYGLSGLRLGYIVCHNTSYYNHIKEYMETMTVGVSTAPQIALFEMLKEIECDPELEQKFITESRDELYKNKFLTKMFDNDILEIPNNVEQIYGMFGWFKVGPSCDFKKARINVVDGGLCGKPGMVRLNLCVPSDILTEAIERLNRESSK